MSWTAPKTWEDNELVTADLLNTHLRDNLDALKSPPTAHFEANEASDYTTTSTSFVDVDGTAGKFNLTITPSGSEVMVGFQGCVDNSGGNGISFDVDVDGGRVGGDDGIARVRGSSAADMHMVSFTRLVTSLEARVPHTFKLQWKVGASTGYLCAGAGTSTKDLHPQFWVREVS